MLSSRIELITYWSRRKPLYCLPLIPSLRVANNSKIRFPKYSTFYSSAVAEMVVALISLLFSLSLLRASIRLSVQFSTIIIYQMGLNNTIMKPPSSERADSERASLLPPSSSSSKIWWQKWLRSCCSPVSGLLITAFGLTILSWSTSKFISPSASTSTTQFMNNDHTDVSFSLSRSDRHIKVRWGIAGLGRIANDFAVVLNVNDGILNAVAAGLLPRTEMRANAFASKFGVTKAYGSYAQLGNDADVDVVYIANTNTHHFHTAIQMLAAGKHVFIEKPLVMNESQARDLFDFANSKACC
jgi:hypothetical protein